MKLSAEVEEPARELIGYAIGGNQDEFERRLVELDNATLEHAVALSMSIAGVVSVHVCEVNPPSDDALRTLAATAQKVERRYTLEAEEVYKYLSQCVFGSSTLPEIFVPHDAVRLPFMIAGNLLGSYAKRKQGQKWPDYLDQIEAAIEATPDPGN